MCNDVVWCGIIRDIETLLLYSIQYPVYSIQYIYSIQYNVLNTSRRSINNGFICNIVCFSWDCHFSDFLFSRGLDGLGLVIWDGVRVAAKY